MSRVRVLDCPVDAVDLVSAVEAVVRLVERGPGRPAMVVTLNPEMVMRARADGEFRALLENAELLVPDGVGVVRALRRRGVPGATRVGGVDLLTAYAPEAARRGHRLALAGGGSGIAERAAARLRSIAPGLDVVADGGDPGAETAARLARRRPHVVCAAYGHGRQERFLAAHLGDIGAAVGIGVGGTLDYLSGAVRRAPLPVRRAGLEWAWRLARQPWRLRRQAVLPLFWCLERREAAAAGARIGPA